jgi:hypothetical protein
MVCQGFESFELRELAHDNGYNELKSLEVRVSAFFSKPYLLVQYLIFYARPATSRVTPKR